MHLVCRLVPVFPFILAQGLWLSVTLPVLSLSSVGATDASPVPSQQVESGQNGFFLSRETPEGHTRYILKVRVQREKEKKIQST